MDEKILIKHHYTKKGDYGAASHFKENDSNISKINRIDEFLIKKEKKNEKNENMLINDKKVLSIKTELGTVNIIDGPFKKEPSLHLASTCNSYQKDSDDDIGNIVNVDEIYLHEEIRSQQHETNPNIISDDHSMDSLGEDNFDNQLSLINSSAPLSDHNYNREISYDDIKRSVFDLNKVVSLLEKSPKLKEECLPQLDYILSTIAAIKTAFNRNTVVYDNECDKRNDIKNKISPPILVDHDDDDDDNGNITLQENVDNDNESFENLLNNQNILDDLNGCEKTIDEVVWENFFDLNKNTLLEKSTLEFKITNIEANANYCNENKVKSAGENCMKVDKEIEGKNLKANENIEQENVSTGAKSNELETKIKEEISKEYLKSAKEDVSRRNSNCTGGSSEYQQDFAENCSEPNEYEPKNDFQFLDKQAATPAPIEESLNDHKLLDSDEQLLEELQSFGERLTKSCIDLKTVKDKSINNLLQEFITDFDKRFRSREKNYINVEIQTDYTGKLLSKENQRRINEKVKGRLLADSDSSEEEFEKLSQSSDSNIYSSEENLSSDIYDGSDIEGEEIRSDDVHSMKSVNSCSDGLDLDKYIEKVNDDDHDDNDKEVSTIEKAQIVDAQDIEYDSEEIVGQMDIECDNQAEKDDNEILPIENHNSSIVNESDLLTLADEKLKMKPVVLVKKLMDDDIDNYYDELREKEIERLLNFDGLNKKTICMPSTRIKSTKGPKKDTNQKLFDILGEDIDKDTDSDQSNAEEENEVLTEKQFLAKYNETFKQQLFDSTSSDTEIESELSDDEKNLENIDNSSNESDFTPLVDKFLEKYTIDNDEKETHEKEEAKKGESIKGDKFNNCAILENNDNLALNDNILEDLEDTKITAENKSNHLNNEEGKNENKNDDAIKSNENEDKRKVQTINLSLGRSALKEKQFDIDAIEAGTSNKINGNDSKDNSEDSDCEILHDSLIKKPRKEKPLNVMMAELDKKRKNAKVDESISLSSDSEDEVENDEGSNTRVLKPMLRQDQLAGETRIAQKGENERIQRLEKKQNSLTKALKEHYKNASEYSKELILDYHSETKTFIKVHPDIVSQMKRHQIEGVKFMYDACYGSVDNIKKYPGSGCILAHCMGLGKTLQLIALLQTVTTYKELKTNKILVLCPKSTVMNWTDEIQRWLGPVYTQLKVYSFPDQSDIQEKIRILQEWSTSGAKGNKRPGVFLMGYEAFRYLVFYHVYKKQKNSLTTSALEAIQKKVKETLLQPGADLVICDEGHIIKNRKSAISSAVAEIKTLRRIILTGTPIQNNLKEYYSMVNFIKPSFLGTEKEFANLYANPIKCGQHKDSSKKEIKIMKQRSFVLHKKLSKFVQRREAALLKTFLPEKFEFVLFIPMSDIQNKLYDYFLESISNRADPRGKSLIPDYTCLRKIWTHPKVLENAWQNAINAKHKRESKKTPTRLNSDEEEPDDVLDSQTGALSVTDDWWRHLICEEDLISLYPSSKIRVMFEILRMCEENGEKCLIFSAFVAVLNVVEFFMKQIHKNYLMRMRNQGSQTHDLGFNKFKGPWEEGMDYYRLDGRTPKTLRHEMVKSFNNAENRRAKCFLISAKAGGQGINLIGANRVIILDTSWNPSNDQQNIFRIFRLGQKKKCYIYRLLAMGTMEEKVYSRSVTKQAMSFRVVDEQQIDRHYNMAELAELYTLNKPDYKARLVPPIPNDKILANLLHNFPNLVYKYHEHDSLLENKMEQELSEQEKKDAWEAYEMDLQSQANAGLAHTPMDNMGGLYAGPGSYLPPFAGYSGRNYPMPYASAIPGALSSLISQYNYPTNAIMDIYNMYQNYATSSLMPHLNSTNQLNSHQFSSNSLLAQQNSMTNPNMLPPPSSINNFSALDALASFSSLGNLPQNTGNNTFTSHTPSYSNATNMNPMATYHSPQVAAESYRRLLDGGPMTSSLDLSVMQQPRLNNNALQMNSVESIPTSVITNSDVHFNQLRNLIAAETAEGSSPKAHIITKPLAPSAAPSQSAPPQSSLPPASASLSVPVSIPSSINSSLSNMMGSITRNNAMINSLSSNQSNSLRGLNMGVLYPPGKIPTNTTTSNTKNSPMVATSKPTSESNMLSGGNISVRSVTSINSATANNYLPAAAITPASINTTPNRTTINNYQPIGEKVSSKSPVTNTSPTQSSTSLTTGGKSFGVVNQIQLSPFSGGKKPTKTAIITTTSPTNSLTITKANALASPSVTIPSKPAINMTTVPSTSKGVNQTITSPKVSNVKTVHKPVLQSTIQQQQQRQQQPPIAKTGHGNSIRTKVVVNRPSPSSNPASSAIVNKQISSGVSQNIPGRQNLAVHNQQNIPKMNSIKTKPNILSASSSKNNTRSPQILVKNNNNSINNKNNVILVSPPNESLKQQSAKNNAALNALSGRNNLSIRPLENKFSNAGITISPGRKLQGGAVVSNPVTTGAAATIVQSKQTPNAAITFTNGASPVILKDRKRPAPPATAISSNLRLALSEDSPISVRQVKRAKMGPPTTAQQQLNSITVRDSSDQLVRIQNTQGLTITPKLTHQNNNQRKNKEGRSSEVVEID